jgi:hypothetical protein
MGTKLLSLILVFITIMFVGNVSGAIDQKKIAGLWLFDELDGDIAKDSSGKGNDGKIKGAVRVVGKFGNALELSGKGYVEVPDADGLKISGNFTMQAWFLAKDINNWRQLIAKDNEYLLRIDPPAEGNKMSAFVRIDNAWEPRASAAVPILGTWTHFAATYDADQLRIYVDGVPSGQSARPGKIVKTKNVVELGRWAGGLVGDDVGYFVGLFDEFAIFNAVLSEEDIKESMNGLQKFKAPVEALGKLAVTWGRIKLYQ